MKLVRDGAKGSEKPGVIDDEGNLRSVSAYLEDIGPAELGPDGLARLHSVDADTLPIVAGEQ